MGESTVAFLLVFTVLHMKVLKNNAIVGNNGHFQNAFDLFGLESMEGMKVDTKKLQKIASSS